jgi:hypothetical protein
MNEVANTTTQIRGTWANDPELMGAGLEIQTYVKATAFNLLQIGRKLTEVKPKIPHGEWEEFVSVNAKMGKRTAEQYMQAWKEFGNNPQIAELGGSQVIRLLPMSEDERARLLNEHDVKGMSVRQMEEEIRKIRKEVEEKRRADIEAEQQKAREAVEAEKENLRIQLAKERERAEQDKAKALEEEMELSRATVQKAWREAHEKIEAAQRQAEDAERRAREVAEREPEIVRETVADPALVEELKRSKEELERMAEAHRALLDGSREWQTEKSRYEEDRRRAEDAWQREKERLQEAIDENEDLIREQQEALNEKERELLNLKSAEKRGDELTFDGEGMTLDTLKRVVREIMGWVVSMPQMHGTFAGKGEGELRQWREQVDTVRAWSIDTLKALDTVNAAEGGYSIE